MTNSSTKPAGWFWAVAAIALMNPENIRDLLPTPGGTRSVQTRNHEGDEKDGLRGKVASHVLYFV